MKHSQYQKSMSSSSPYERCGATYGIKIRRGGRVQYTDHRGKRIGTITHCDGHYVHIRFDGFDLSEGPFHPTWNLVYDPPEEKPARPQ